MSLAHRILKLRNKADIHELKEETALLYEKLSILSFVEKHFEGVKPTIKKYDIEKSIQKEFNLEHTVNLNYPDGTEYNEEPIYEHNTEKIKDIVSQMPFEAQVVDQLFEEPEKKAPETKQPGDEAEEASAENKNNGNDDVVDKAAEDKTEEPQQDDAAEHEDNKETKDVKDIKVDDPVEVEDFGVHFDDLPDFEPAEEKTSDEKDKEASEKEVKKGKEAKKDNTKEKPAKEETEEKPQRTMDLFSQNKKSLNDKLNKDLKIGLNDRLSFVNHLFKGDSKTYETFIGSINALESLDDVKEFLNEQIQDKYEFWRDKEEIANRLLHLIEKKFE